MPHIIVVADGRQDPKEGAVMLRERISSSDLESQHFAVQLLERLEWAVEDAHEAERTTPRSVTRESRAPSVAPEPSAPESSAPAPSAPEPSAPDQRSASVLTTA